MHLSVFNRPAPHRRVKENKIEAKSLAHTLRLMKDQMAGMPFVREMLSPNTETTDLKSKI